ncbi:MAG: dUTP diphosphatase [Myxococcota bacterium]
MVDQSNQIEIPILWVGKATAYVPEAQTPQAAGLDLRADLNAPFRFEPSRRVLVPTGIAIELPAGFEAQVRPRSGLAWNHGITVLNGPGTIDTDYRGEIKVLLIHLGEEQYTIQPGERIAQLVVAPVWQVEWKPVDGLADTERNPSGFGSTGMQ